MSRSLQHKIIKDVQAAYPAAYVRRLCDPGSTSPDILILFPVMFRTQTGEGEIELERTVRTLLVHTLFPGSPLTPAAKKGHERIAGAGGAVIVVTESDSVLKLLQGLAEIP